MRKLRQLSLKPDSRCLDFGCGTGLFASVFTKEGLHYCGYDIDERLIRYANNLYQNNKCFLTASIDELKNQPPFNMIMAN